MSYVRSSNLQMSKITSLLLAILAVGCGGDNIVPVAAKVTLDGAPLQDASVSFIRAEGEEGRAAFGMTDEQGVARLTTYKPFDGALPGEYSVTVLKAPEDARTYEEAPAGTDSQSLLQASASRGGGQASRRKRVRTVIPEVYGATNTTPLSCKVERGMDEPVFALTSER